MMKIIIIVLVSLFVFCSADKINSSYQIEKEFSVATATAEIDRVIDAYVLVINSNYYLVIDSNQVEFLKSITDDEFETLTKLLKLRVVNR